MRHDRRCFGRLEQKDQRLKKHYGRWMDIIQSLELESFILTNLTKPSVPVNLVGPQVSLPQWWVPASRGVHFFVCNKEALPCVRRYSWWVRHVSGGGRFFREIQRPFWWVPAARWRNHYFARTVHGRWMSFFDQVDQAAPRAPWRWTTARPRKGTTLSQGRLGSGCPRGGEYEGLLVWLPSPENNRRCV